MSMMSIHSIKGLDKEHIFLIQSFNPCDMTLLPRFCVAVFCSGYSGIGAVPAPARGLTKHPTNQPTNQPTSLPLSLPESASASTSASASASASASELSMNPRSRMILAGDEAELFPLIDSALPFLLLARPSDNAVCIRIL